MTKDDFVSLMARIGARLVATVPYERWIASIGPREAEALLAVNDPGQRKRIESAVATYAVDMLSKRWMRCVNPLSFSSEDFTMYDGQHRCWAVVKSGTTQEFEIVVRPRSTVAALDAQKARSISATRKALGIGRPIHNTAQAAAEVALFGPEPHARKFLTRTQRIAAVDQFSDAAIEMAHNLASRWTVRLPAGCVAAAIKAHTVNPKLAEEFFIGVAQNRHTVFGSASNNVRLLSNWIQSEARRKNNTGGGYFMKESFCRAISAFNAEVRGEQLTKIHYFRDRAVPEIAPASFGFRRVA